MKGIPIWPAIAAVLMTAVPLAAQNITPASGPPPSTGGVFPLSEVHAGLKATAWTVFTGTTPEAMDVEILGVLHGARGPGHDLILAQLHGAKPEYTGVVAGMSGSPVYVGNRLLGSLSYRIGQFSKDPIAGITPIEQMLEVRDLPMEGSGVRDQRSAENGPSAQTTIHAIETPLMMSGFRPEAIRLWQEKMAGTGLDMIAAGGGSGRDGSGRDGSGQDQKPLPAAQLPGETSGKSSTAFPLEPGSAVSAELVRGDLEIAATCTVTYIDPKQLLACGHPILQAGAVSLPMTTAEVVATLASPLNAFKIINTGKVVGAFTQDRDSAIRGVLGEQAHMIPLHLDLHGVGSPRKLNVEVLNLPELTPQAVMVSLYEVLLETNDSTFETSYHLTGHIDLAGYPPSPVDIWAPAGDQLPAQMMAALTTAERFLKLYSNSTLQGSIKAIDLDVEAIPRRVQVELEAARLVTNDIVHAGDTVVVEATIHNWQQPARNVRIPVTLPARLSSGNLRLLVSDAGTLDRTLDQPRIPSRSPDIDTVLAEVRAQHPADRIYISLLVPEAQANMNGETLASVPLSVANALEPLRTVQDVNLNGESAELAAQAPAGGVLSGFQVLNLHIEPGGGLN
ncbi:MAG: SpoIVB peptidase S55 [Terracidiphilus sp.]